MPEVRFYGTWNRESRIELGRGRKGYAVVLTSVPGGAHGMAFVFRLRRKQTVKSVQDKATTLAVEGLMISAKAHDARHVRVVLRGHEVDAAVQHVQYLRDQGNAITDALPIPLLHGLARATTDLKFESGVREAILKFLPHALDRLFFIADIICHTLLLRAFQEYTIVKLIPFKHKHCLCDLTRQPHRSIMQRTEVGLSINPSQ